MAVLASQLLLSAQSLYVLAFISGRFASDDGDDEAAMVAWELSSDWKKIKQKNDNSDENVDE